MLTKVCSLFFCLSLRDSKTDTNNMKSKFALQASNIKPSDYLLIVIGSFLQALSYVLFLAPYKIVPGGVYGISIVLHYSTKGLIPLLPEGLPIGATALCFNIPLMFLAMKK